MLKLSVKNRKAGAFQLLCLGAHADDIEIGCGGTVLKWLEDEGDAEVHWVVFSASDCRGWEALESANELLSRGRRKHIIIHRFRDGFLPYVGSQIKDCFEELKTQCSPDLILTHYRGDLHQDHRLISELTWNTFRDHWILEYEIPKYDGDFGSPNLFVHLDENLCNQKIDHILSFFQTQKDKRWFSREVFLSMLRLRGMESNAPSTYAEGFYCRKLVL
ncbi:MAG: PIG-L family deacetylase [Acidobacteria bacterium]|nr:PIG-L family deacetylase [Acidobacteriota bacterium]